MFGNEFQAIDSETWRKVAFVAIAGHVVLVYFLQARAWWFGLWDGWLRPANKTADTILARLEAIESALKAK